MAERFRMSMAGVKVTNIKIIQRVYLKNTSINL